MILNFIIISIIIIIDQISKFLIEKKFIDINTIPIIKDFLHLTYVKNRGVAFGFFYGHVYIFVFIALIAVIGMILYLHKKNEEHSIYSRLGFIFILGGAFGNLIDRAFRGYVVDFIDFRGIWPYIFNVADVSINIGVILILLEYILEKEKISKEEK